MKNFITTMAKELIAAFEREYAEAEQYKSTVSGTVRSLPEGMTGIWDVDGREVNVPKGTFIKADHGKAEVGASVEVEGTLSGKTLNAYRIAVTRGATEAQKIRGAVDKLPVGKYEKWSAHNAGMLVATRCRHQAKA
ncbi:hypothetical protein GeomeDRAFT_1815 [Geobacter metallireducens RCH3]|uniref:Uncharacterized protein n=1 Tax=Geobacter metallireducens (strain ATCC 53774 / DSM 7210 / GS-15) TaxID=269799 RepID=Q39WV9_GEOMG|nr:hypothetical protein [Geobacter metallireducens]ABB31265.1 hypothetical protein Gmet_1024 [Geobacter metallireducens GS-15]EHP86509.1 hypothetical protein GeomeDRAFT_1815 [Geobacter metallireducens RCH3]